MSITEKFCLKWNDFQQNISNAFGSLRGDIDFADVTLVCEDDQQIEAHKIVLAASSPFFQNLLMKNKHTHPLIYMRGIRSEDLVAILDFLYHGEANIPQDSLDNFLIIAEELKLKGLTNAQDDQNNCDKSSDEYKTKIVVPKQEGNKTVNLQVSNIVNDTLGDEDVSRTVAVPSSLNEGLHALDLKIKSMIVVSQNSMPNGKRVNICTICGKEGVRQTIIDHIETHHIEGVSHPCNMCKKTFRSRPALKAHNYSNHKN